MTVLIITGSLIILILAIAWVQKIVYRRYWNVNLSFNVKASSNAIFEGDTIEIIESISNGKKLFLPWVHASYKFSRSSIQLSYLARTVYMGAQRSLLFVVGMNKTVSRKSRLEFSKRGYYEAKELSIASNNLFMTGFIKEDVPIHFGMLVYPRIVDYSESTIPLKKMLGDIIVKRFIDPDPFTFKGVREYQPYDSFRQVNWNATAKTGEIMSNIYDFTIYQDVTVLLDIHEYRLFDRDYVHEEAIRITAFICRSCINRGIPVSLICSAPDETPVKISSGMSSVHLEKLYTALAHIDLNKKTFSVAEYVPSSSEKAYILVSSFSERSEIEVSTGTDTVKLEVQNNASA